MCCAARRTGHRSRRVAARTAAKAGAQYLEQRIHRIALTGRLGVSEARSVELVHGVGLGTVLALLERPADISTGRFSRLAA